MITKFKPIHMSDLEVVNFALRPSEFIIATRTMLSDLEGYDFLDESLTLYGFLNKIDKHLYIAFEDLNNYLFNTKEAAEDFILREVDYKIPFTITL